MVNSSVVIPAAELHERFSRSSGPGGQGVNTADSRVELSFDVARSAAIPQRLRPRVLERLGNRLVDGVLTVAASEHRAQLQNRQAAREPPPHPADARFGGTQAGLETPPRERQARSWPRDRRLRYLRGTGRYLFGMTNTASGASTTEY